MQVQHAVEVEELHASFEAEREDYDDQLGTLSQAFEKRGKCLVVFDVTKDVIEEMQGLS